VIANILLREVAERIDAHHASVAREGGSTTGKGQ